MSTPAPLEPDTKDWTWVLDRACPDCGFDAASIDRARLGDVIRDNAAAWSVLLAAPGVRERPRPDAWSPTEYACHVRDVHHLFRERVQLMLDDDEPTFDNWDQDATAVADRYDLADPAELGPVLVVTAEDAAAAYDAVPDEAWSRRGLRSNGDEFTVESLGRYHLHDVVHHLWDVRGVGMGT